MDSKGNLWIGTPIGLSILSPDGNWSSIRGADGLPVEEITALEIDKNDNSDLHEDTVRYEYRLLKSKKPVHSETVKKCRKIKPANNQKYSRSFLLNLYFKISNFQ